jgi:hydroxymethylpyrimidine kinase/phosphomethylpyrimidine kinase
MNQVKNKPPKICLSIAGLDPSGGAGILADVKTFGAFGCYGAAAVTSVTFQNTVGVFGAVHETAESVRRQVEAIYEDLKVSAVKSGMLPTRGIISTIADMMGEFRVSRLVVDPVVRSTSGYDLIGDSALKVLIQKLFPLAIVVTPNLQEAERITGMKISSESDIEKAAGLMLSMGAGNVLIKGGHFTARTRGGRATDFLFGKRGVHTFESGYVKTKATHGTGCTLSAAIASNLALGFSLKDSVGSAKDYVYEAIRTAPKIGHGHSPVNHLVKSERG